MEPQTVEVIGTDYCMALPPAALCLHAHDGKTVLTVHADGHVELGDRLNLDAIKALPLPYLRMVREIVSVAIYDAERDR